MDYFERVRKLVL